MVNYVSAAILALASLLSGLFSVNSESKLVLIAMGFLCGFFLVLSVFCAVIKPFDSASEFYKNQNNNDL